MHLVKILIPALILMIVALAATAYGLVKVRNYQWNFQFFLLLDWLESHSYGVNNSIFIKNNAKSLNNFNLPKNNSKKWNEPSQSSTFPF